MKRCPECNAIFEDSIDVCPTCGERLDPFWGTSKKEKPDESPKPNVIEHAQNSPYVFEQTQGNYVIINGSVAETSTQQYYQSGFTKIIHALFSGEPYQFSHTTFVTIIRVEEHTNYGYPENARDITLYGNMQNVFAVGDDVTVTAQRQGNRIIAKDIYNHSIDDRVHIQPYISATIIRVIALLCVVLLLFLIVSIDFKAVFTAIIGIIAMVVVLRWLFKFLIGGLFK